MRLLLKTEEAGSCLHASGTPFGFRRIEGGHSFPAGLQDVFDGTPWTATDGTFFHIDRGAFQRDEQKTRIVLQHVV